MIRFLIISFFIFFAVSCNKKTYQSCLKEKINEYISENSDKYDMFIIIPGSGCTGCITQAEDFFLNNYKNHNIKFIFTNVLSYKILKAKLGEDKITQKNVFIDKMNSFYLNDFQERIYPFKIRISENKAINIERLDN